MYSLFKYIIDFIKILNKTINDVNFRKHLFFRILGLLIFEIISIIDMNLLRLYKIKLSQSDLFNYLNWSNIYPKRNLINL